MILPLSASVLIPFFLATAIVDSADVEDVFYEENHVDVTCQSKCNTTLDDFEQLGRKIYTNQLLCFVRCRLLKKNLMSEDGVIYTELVRKNIYLSSPGYFAKKNLDCLDNMPQMASPGALISFIQCLT